MLQYLQFQDVGPAPHMEIAFHERMNFLVGDNGLGKTFLLDAAWWALTRTWARQKLMPHRPPTDPRITYRYTKKSGGPYAYTSRFDRESEHWPLAQGRPPIPGLVLYAQVDGGFSVWDPARNYWRTDPNRPAAYHFKADEVWNGLEVNGQRVCEGLERDWVNWQEGRKPQFTALAKVLEVMSPLQEPLRAGPPQRVFIGEGRDRPTLLVGNQTVPVALASAGVRRILALVYFLVWAWHEHAVAAKLLGKKPEDRFVILFDEPETHLHPRWQRTVLPSLFKAVDELRGQAGTPPQVLVATHSPLVAASVEPIFDES